MKNEFSILRTINEAIKEEEREKKEITSWHCSKLGSCLRGIYLDRIGAKPDEELNERTLRVFHCGNIFEKWLIDLISIKKKEEDYEIETQKRVEDKELGVSGRVDLIIRKKDEIVFEIKSKHSQAFWYMLRNGKPMEQHEQQLWIYLYLLNIPKGILVYISKDDLAIQQYEVYLADGRLKEKVFYQLDLLNKAWKKKDPSILPLPEEKSWQAKYCQYHSQCVKL